MRVEFKIDCQTFLRLTGETLGLSRSELYVIKPDGVQFWKDGVDTTELARGWGASHADALLLDLADEARLPFPTTAVALIEWQRKNTEFELPSWFQRTVDAQRTADAHAELDSADAEYKAKQDAAARKIAKLKTSGSKAGEWYPAEVEWNTLLALRAAIECLRAQTSLPTGSIPRKQSRLDAIAEEIERALEVLDKQHGRQPTPAEVMAYLRRLAGEPGSCITAAAPTYVMWCRPDGSPEKLGMNTLKSRLLRRRRKT